MSDAKILQFGGEARDPATLNNFVKTIYSVESQERVASSIAAVCHIDDYVVVNEVSVLTNGSDPRIQGSLFGKVLEQDDVTVFTSTAFPIFLRDNTPILPEQAVELAADMSNAYGIFARGRNLIPAGDRSRVFPDTRQMLLWEPAYSFPAAESVPYRAAAAVALHAQGLSSLKAKQRLSSRSFLPHVSALMDPFNPNEMLRARKLAKLGA